jgi:hypothetical protein
MYLWAEVQESRRLVLTLNKNLSITSENVRHRLALVTWRDSVSHPADWIRLDRIIKGNGKVAVGYSVGWIISLDRETVVICPNVVGIPGDEYDHTDGNGGMTIPREAVVSIKYLT